MNSPSKMQLSGMIWRAATAFMTEYHDCAPCSLLFLLQYWSLFPILCSWMRSPTGTAACAFASNLPDYEACCTDRGSADTAVHHLKESRRDVLAMCV